MNLLQTRIAELVAQHGSMRAAARVLRVDHAYLSRLASGEKDNPSDALLRKLRLRRVVSYAPATSTPREQQGERVDVPRDVEQDARRFRWLADPPYRWYVQVMSDLFDAKPRFCVIGKDLRATIDAALSDQPSTTR